MLRYFNNYNINLKVLRESRKQSEESVKAKVQCRILYGSILYYRVSCSHTTAQLSKLMALFHFHLLRNFQLELLSSNLSNLIVVSAYKQLHPHSTRRVRGRGGRVNKKQDNNDDLWGCPRTPSLPLKCHLCFFFLLLLFAS